MIIETKLSTELLKLSFVQKDTPKHTNFLFRHYTALLNFVFNMTTKFNNFKMGLHQFEFAFHFPAKRVHYKLV